MKKSKRIGLFIKNNRMEYRLMIIEQLFNDYLSSGVMENSYDVKREQSNFEQVVNAVTEDIKEREQLLDFAAAYGMVTEQQGFLHGFTYAVILIHECIHFRMEVDKNK
jgi:tetrahydromethanopterin S-methyltransferase subunit F